MTVPIVCSQCGATYSKIALPPGTSFACGDCGHALTVPGASQAPAAGGLPVVTPTRPGRAPNGPAAPGRPGPVVQPSVTGRSSRAAPRGASPRGGKPTGRAPGRPGPARPSLPSGPTNPPVVQPTGSPAAGAAPVMQPRPTPTRTPGVGQPTAKPGVVQPTAQPAVVQPTPPSGGAAQVNRKTTRRPPTRVVQDPMSLHNGRPKSNKPLILASVFGGVALVTLVAVLIATGGPAKEDLETSYMAGYETGLRNRFDKMMGLPGIDTQGGFDVFKQSFGGEADHGRYLAGLAHSQDDVEPEVGTKASLIERAFDPTTARNSVENMMRQAGDDPVQLFAVADRLEPLADRLEAIGIPRTAARAHLSLRGQIVDRVLALDPNHAQIRAERKEFRYQDELLPFTTAEFLDAAERDKAVAEHQRLKAKAEANHGWLTADSRAAIERFESKYADRAQAHTEFASSEFYTKAIAMRDAVAADLAKGIKAAQDRLKEIEDSLESSNPSIPKEALKTFADQLRASVSEGLADREYEAIVTFPPYVLFVEKDESWDPNLNAKIQIIDPLNSMRSAFLENYQKRFGLKEPTEPIPVVYFRTSKAYQQYNFGANGTLPNPNILAHFEHETGRLVVHAETDKSTVMHEGVHQLFWFHANVKADFEQQSYWFQEGVAEWFSGHKRSLEDGVWKYELGKLQEGRILGARTWFGRNAHYRLEDLIGITYGDRAKPETNHGLVYAQGWALLYFLNYFDVEPDGRVKIDTKENPVVGKYRPVFDKMLEYVLTGKGGQAHTGKAAFLDAAGVSSPDELAQMSDDFDRFQRFLARKLQYGHFKDKELIPWDQYRNKKGQASGEAADDQLPPSRAKDWKPGEGEEGGD